MACFSMAVVCAVAMTLAGIRFLCAYRPASPSFEALLFGVPPIALALQIGVFRAAARRGPGRAFWAGFVAFGFLSVVTFVGTFVWFPDSMETPLVAWGYCVELTNVALYGVLPSWVITQYPFVFWLGTAVLLFLPHLLVASFGGILTHRFRRAVSRPPQAPALEECAFYESAEVTPE